jgi:hypothetical protein
MVRKLRISRESGNVKITMNCIFTGIREELCKCKQERAFVYLKTKPQSSHK